MGCVKNITCKVIKRLEGLEHLEMVDIDTLLLEDEQLDEDGEDREVEEVFYPLGKEATMNGRASSRCPKMARLMHNQPRNRSLTWRSCERIYTFP